MRKLLSANFARLWKSRPFWLILFALVALGAFSNVPGPWNSLADLEESASVEDTLFQLIPYFPFVCALFVSLFLGVEFESHTIRNKLIVGHTRTEVFFAADLTCMVGSLCLLAGMLLSSGVTACLFSRKIQMPWMEFSYLMGCCVLVGLVFSGICVAFIMNIPTKPAIFLVLFFVVMLYATSFMGARLQETEMTYDAVTITMDGVEFGDLVKNPAYVEGMTRKTYEFLCDLLPTGQTIQLNNGELERSLRWAPLSLLMLAGTTLAGFLPFRKREIR